MSYQVCHYVVDTESTGPNDGIFAFGIAWCVGTDIRKAQTRQVVLQLRTLEEIQNRDSWERVWRNHRFDMTTFNEFWRDKSNILYALQDPQDPCVLSTVKDFINAINDLIFEAEHVKGATKCILWVDTVASDVPEISHVLARQNFPRFQFTREGTYRPGMEIDSYIKGLLNCKPDAPWEEVDALEKKHMRHLWKIQPKYDHQPGNDALFNLQRVVAAIQYQDMHDLTRKKAALLVFFGFILSLIFSYLAQFFF